MVVLEVDLQIEHPSELCENSRAQHVRHLEGLGVDSLGSCDVQAVVAAELRNGLLEGQVEVRAHHRPHFVEAQFSGFAHAELIKAGMNARDVVRGKRIVSGDSVCTHVVPS